MGLIQPDPVRKNDLYMQGGEFYIALKKTDGTFDDYQFLGMTTETSASIEVETVDYKQTETMPPTKAESVITSMSGALKASVSQISAGILALMFLGTSEEWVQSAGSYDGTMTVKGGYSYLLGNIKFDSITVANSDDSVTYVEGTDYKFDSEAGMLGILRDGSIADGDTIHITGSYGDATAEIVEAMTTPNIEAKIRFISDPLAGKKKIWDFHKVKVKASGDFALKSAEDYGVAELEMELLQDDTITTEGLSKIFKVTNLS